MVGGVTLVSWLLALSPAQTWARGENCSEYKYSGSPLPALGEGLGVRAVPGS